MSDSGSSRATGVWLVVLTLLSWAAVPLFLHQFKQDRILDPFTSNGWRYGVSALFWLPYLGWLASRKQLPRGLLLAALVPVAFNIPGQTAFAWGPTLLEPGFFSFIFRIQILFVALGAYLLFPAERAVLRTPQFWIGAALVAAGSIGLFLFHVAPEGHAAVEHDGKYWLGVAVAIASGVLFAGYGLSVRYFVSKYPPIPAFGVICQFTAVGMVAIMLILGTGHGNAAFRLSLPQWGVLVASAFIGIAISHVMYYAALRRLGVSIASGILQLQPIFTAAGSFLIFGERLTTLQWASGLVGVGGAVLMLAAGSIAHKRRHRRSRPKARRPGRDDAALCEPLSSGHEARRNGLHAPGRSNRPHRLPHAHARDHQRPARRAGMAQ
ncbi:MAG: DMT family transporter [Phycisphaerales bacterium]